MLKPASPGVSGFQSPETKRNRICLCPAQQTVVVIAKGLITPPAWGECMVTGTAAVPWLDAPPLPSLLELWRGD